NDGSVTWASGGILTGEGALIENAGSFEISGDDALSFGFGGATPSFHNTGLVRKTGGSGSTSIQIPFDNEGILDAASGTLSLDGTLTNYSSTSRTLSGGTYLVSATLAFGGADVVTNAATVVLDGAAAAIE